MKTIYCPQCGADSQNVESYCRRCGRWLPDIDALTRPKLFRKLSREEKIKKMRLLEIISAGLSFVSVVVMLSVLFGNNDKKFLFLGVICCLLVALYQLVNFYIGSKLGPKSTEERAEEIKAINAKPEPDVAMPKQIDGNQFIEIPSAAEHTTELLDAPQAAKRTQ